MKATIFILISFLLLCNTSFAEAHGLKTDNSIGALLHMTPDDDPIAGEPTQLFFTVKDTQNTFSTQNCDCKIIITQNGKQIAQKQTTQDPDNTTELLATYTFPQKELYQVTLHGTPTTPKTFTPFTLTYDIRVARETETQKYPEKEYVLPSVIGAIIIVLLYIFLKKR